MRRRWTTALGLATAALIAAPAVAAPGLNVRTRRPALKKGAAAGPQLKIETANLTKADGTRVELTLGLFKRGERERHSVEVWFVDGARRHRLWSGQANFASVRGGFSHNVAVDLRGRNLRRGHLEVKAASCSGPGCVRRVNLPGAGGNLKFAGHERVERRGTDRLLTLEVTNTGSAASSPCKLQVFVEGRKRKTFNLGAVRPRDNTTFQFRFPHAQRGKAYEAKLVCRDLVRFDNVRRSRLP